MKFIDFFAGIGGFRRGSRSSKSKSVKAIVDHNKDFEEIKNAESLKGVFFATKEECQKFCDYINGTEAEGYDYNLAGKLIKAREV